MIMNMAGGWRDNIEKGVQGIKQQIDARLIQVSQEINRLTATDGELRQAISQVATTGSASAGTGGLFTHKMPKHCLIKENELALPEFPTVSLSVDEFRLWMTSFVKHCGRNGNYPCMDVLVEAARKPEHQIDTKETVDAMLLVAKSTATEDHPDGPSQVMNAVRNDDLKKGLYEAIEHCAKGKCENILSQVKADEGYEVIRMLCRQFDPRNPDLRQLLQSELFGMANRKCQDVSSVVARMMTIDKIVVEMQAQCGEAPNDATLADIFAPSLDASTVYQLSLYRDNRGQSVNNKSYQSLKDYVRNRQVMERSLEPIKPRKMDVGSFEAPSYADVAASPSPPWVPTEETPVQAAWMGQPEVQWHPVPYDGALDALYRERSKSKGKDTRERRKLACHNCGGEGHPFKLCTSQWGAKDKGGKPCEVGAGLGHSKANCPSPGGAKYVPRPAKGDGKGKPGKGKGKDGGKWQYFSGKGSGTPLPALEERTYSPAEWYAWDNQEKNAYPQAPAQPPSGSLSSTANQQPAAPATSPSLP